MSVVKNPTVCYPRELKICKLCQTDVEDEVHFLLKCESLERECLLLYKICPEVLNYCTDLDKCLFLFSKPHVMGNYVQKLWQLHEELMQNMTDVSRI